ncbi:hypothetical protein Nepgr_003784 [Nepenthes gracilis]|uniref:Reverse transcriptase/retrotransposon-derived protein RNase H-like domain-containing protein n=1 Tax=Nepenthes gracilis TaxID=150966 RepID=A0AAD3S060_NEPGR|nr:hypothetical protein Nepgr_003784 [Nepenthes gracilis]
MISSADAANARHGPPEIASSSKRAKLGVRNDVISFSSEDMAHVTSPHTDPLVVSALVSAGGDDYQLKRVFIDNGSSQNLLYLTAFTKLGLKRSQMKAANGPLYGLDNEPVPVQGIIRLEVTMGTHPRSMTRELAFLVVDLPSVYNAILGRPFLTAFKAVTSIPHLKVKFPTPWGVGEVLGDQEMGRTCYLSQISPMTPCGPSEDLDLRDETSLQQAQSGEETEAIPLDPSDPERCVSIGKSLQPGDRDRLITFLRTNSDVFAWGSADMPGISAEVIVHKPGLDARRKPVPEVQKLTGRIAALSRFLAKSAEKYLPFFKALRGTKSHGFKWSEECDEAFRELKTYLSSAPLLSSPREGEDLYLYGQRGLPPLGLRWAVELGEFDTEFLAATGRGKGRPADFIVGSGNALSKQRTTTRRRRRTEIPPYGLSTWTDRQPVQQLSRCCAKDARRHGDHILATLAFRPRTTQNMKPSSRACDRARECSARAGRA